MVSLQPPICDFGWKARDFDLLGVDGKRYNLANACGKNGLLVMFICNHCPYVKAVIGRIADEAKALQALGIGKQLGIVRIEHDLQQAFAVAQVDEDDSAMVAPPVHPARQSDGLPGVGAA